MLTPNSREALSKVLSVGCFLRLYPYVWDKDSYRLKHTSKGDINISRFYGLNVTCYVIFIAIRTIQTMRVKMETQIRITQIIWFFALLLVIFSYIQFERKRNAILAFINAVFEFIEEESKHVSDTRNHKKFNWISINVIIGTSLLFLNIPVHATVLIEIPCAPHCITSLIFACKTPMDNNFPIHYKLPFLVFEIIGISAVVFNWYFNWVCIFLSLSWIKQKMNRIQSDKFIHECDLESLAQKYRRIQVLAMVMNDTFRIYLEIFCSILFGLSSVLMFGVIRFYHLEFHMYLVFPFCAMRCLLEGSSCLEIAGTVNVDSQHFLARFKSRVAELSRSKSSFEWTLTRKKWRAFVRSCPRIRCTAGSFYTFDHSILLSCFSNCIRLTFDLLVTFR